MFALRHQERHLGGIQSAFCSVCIPGPGPGREMSPLPHHLLSSPSNSAHTQPVLVPLFPIPNGDPPLVPAPHLRTCRNGPSALPSRRVERWPRVRPGSGAPTPRTSSRQRLAFMGLVDARCGRLRRDSMPSRFDALSLAGSAPPK